MKLKTILGWLAVALLLFLMIKDPTGGASIINHIGGFLSGTYHGFVHLVESL